jgi:hypothetical protein
MSNLDAAIQDFHINNPNADEKEALKYLLTIEDETRKAHAARTLFGSQIKKVTDDEIRAYLGETNEQA